MDRRMDAAIDRESRAGYDGGMRRLAALAVWILVLGACASESTEPEPPEPIGPLAYEVVPTWCPSACEIIELHRDGADLQLLIFTADHEFDRELLTTLASDAAATLDAEIEALVEGDAAIGELDPACLGFADAPRVTLVLSGRASFGYPWNCPPSGLAEIDAVYQGVVSSSFED